MLDVANVGKIADVKEKIDEGNEIAAEVINNSINPTNAAEANSKAIHELMLAFETNNELNPEQITQGHSISIQNIVEGGTDIYTMRAMLNEDVIDDIELSSSSRKANQQSQFQGQERTFKGLIYPNPAKDQITYTCSVKDDPNAILKITDAFGKLIYIGKIQNGIAIINTISFNSGIYFYSCILQDGTKHSDRFTIIK
ncbi:MAG: T9SS type A sorting domain-containing protein [Bacteroidota bacterium]